MSGPGLKKEGVIVLQSFFIAFFAGFELLIRSGAGIVSGLIICIVLFGGIRLGALAPHMFQLSLHHLHLPQQLSLI